jgi:C-terminal processing protease CtpA/Prc
MTDEKTRIRILDAIVKHVLKHHINIAGVDYDTWRASLAERTGALLKADELEFELGVRDSLTGLGTSHTGFYHSQPREMLPQHTINATVRAIETEPGERWMFLDVFEDGPAHQAGIQPGDILEAIDDQPCLPPQMPQFGIGRTHSLRIERFDCSPRTLSVAVPYRKGTKQRPPMVEPKSPVFLVAAPGVGLLKVPHFHGAFGMRFGEALDGAINNLVGKRCDRLIIDLRGSLGGSLGFARLASYMCPDQIPIGHSLTPKRLRDGYEIDQLPRVPMPKTKPELILTLARFSFRDKSLMLMTQGLGPQPFHKKIVVLVNEWTNSAAEMLAAFAAENDLAAVVGRKTRGNVLGATNFRLPAGYWLRLPVFGWFTSRGRLIEGTGVQPSECADEAAAFASGEDRVMARALAVIGAQ